MLKKDLGRIAQREKQLLKKVLTLFLSIFYNFDLFVFPSSDSELEACVNFVKEVINNISENAITFHADLLSNKIAEVCLGPIHKVIFTFAYYIAIKVLIYTSFNTFIQ